jgi:hypothetical protein
MNEAQKLLVRIGGVAELVAGHMQHYWADISTAAKPKRQRAGQIGKGRFGLNVMASFDAKRGDLQERQATHTAYLAKQEAKREERLRLKILTKERT